MYSFSYFKEKDQQVILDFLKEHPFVVLTGSFKDGKQMATQVPVFIEEKNNDLFIQAHIMRNTDHYKALVENPNALMLFTGPQAYISASWYDQPQSGSTWNYMSVHVYGQIRFMSSNELREFMSKFTLYYENGNLDSPTIFENLPKEYQDLMLPAIVGIELKVEKMDHVFKLSQNRNETSYLNIISHLEKQNADCQKIAEEMKKRKKNLFPD